MKVKTPLPSLLILVGLSAVLGLREQPPEEVMLEAVCMVKCENNNKPRECKDACESDQRDIPVLEVEANANPRHVCQLDDGPLIELDSGVYIVERRNQSSDWVDDGIRINALGRRYFHYSTSEAGQYQWRFSRVFADGISRTQISEWVTVHGPGVKPPNVLDIWVQCFTVQKAASVYGRSTVTVEIGYTLPEDTSCVYEFTRTRDLPGSSESNLIYLTGSGSLNPVFEDLPLGSRFVVSVRPKAWSEFPGSDDNTSTQFVIPSAWPADADSQICVPNETVTLEATTTLNKEKNDYDVTVTWDRRDSVPDFFIVELTPVDQDSNPYSRNVPGTATETIFRGVNISQQFDVSIRAWTILGRGPETSKRVTISGSGTIVITAVLVYVSLVVASGVCA